jgi:hypothetical protein
MKGVVVEKVGAPAIVVDNLEKPKPAEDQVLVKSIYAALNPMYATSCTSCYEANFRNPVSLSWLELVCWSSSGLMS